MLTFRAATLIVLVTITLINDSFSETRMTQRFLVKRAAHEKAEGNRSPPRLPGGGPSGGQGAGSQRQFGSFALEKLHRFVRSPQNNPPTLMMAEGMPQGPPPCGHHGPHGPHGPGGSPPPSPASNPGEGATTTNA